MSSIDCRMVVNVLLMMSVLLIAIVRLPSASFFAGYLKLDISSHVFGQLA